MTKEENILGVLMHLFNFYMKNQIDMPLKDEALLPHLEKAGFKRPVIIQALNWLGNLSEHQNTPSRLPHGSSIRVFNTFERQLLDTDCQGFILSLEQQGILTPLVRETVIDQVLQLEQEEIDINLIKWVTLMVLFSQPDQHKALQCMEFLVLHDEIIDSVN
jgi:Smg protein